MKSKYLKAGLLSSVLFVLVFAPFVLFVQCNRLTVSLFMFSLAVFFVLPVCLYCERKGLLDDSDK